MILIAGPPGAGKSVQAELLEEEAGLKWLSMGALLRQSVDEDVKSIMARGEMLDDELVESVLSQAVSKIDSSTKILLDGFPRRDSQVQWFIDFAERIDRDFEHAIHIKISLDSALKRLAKRGRADDQEEVIKHRYEIYEKDILPMLSSLEKMGVKIHNIDGEQHITDVHKSIVSALKDHLN